MRINVDINIHHHRKPRRRVALVLWTFGPVQEQRLPGPKTEAAMQPMTDSQFVSGKVQPQTKRGKPAAIQAGSAKFTSSDDEVVTVAQDAADELGVTVTAVAAGAARVTCTFDADLGDGVVPVEVVADFSITSGPAVGGGFAFGAPQEQPEQPEA
jgi:hypothetical protein